MSNVARRPNGKWRARLRPEVPGQPGARHFTTEAEAWAWIHAAETGAVHVVDHGPPVAARTVVLFRDYVTSWQRVQMHATSTAQLIDGVLRNHILPAFGDRPLAEIRRSDVQTWVKHLSLTLAPSTVQTVFNWFVAICSAAVVDELIPASPASKIRLPRTTASKIRPLEAHQVEALALAAPPHYSTMVRFAAATGMRQGEVFGLCLDRIDWLRRQVSVDQQLIVVTGQPPHLGPPKTKASHRTIPIPAALVSELAAHVEAFPVVHEWGLVFTNARGNPIRRNRFADEWGAIRYRADLGRSAVFHDLRHFYASALIRAGESIKVVQARLGHATATETLDTYGHLWDDNDDTTRAAVEDLLGTMRDSGGTAGTGQTSWSRAANGLWTKRPGD